MDGLKRIIWNGLEKNYLNRTCKLKIYFKCFGLTSVSKYTGNSVKTPFGNGRISIFQQNKIFRACVSIIQTLFRKENINILGQPAKTPDLAKIEIAWGSLLSTVYSSSKHYDTCGQLKIEICKTWINLSTSYIYTLDITMKDRIFKLIQSKD